jgi:hypothetical protein
LFFKIFNAYHTYKAIKFNKIVLKRKNTIKSYFLKRTKPVKPTNDLTYREKGAIAAFAGAVAAVISNPFEVINIR